MFARISINTTATMLPLYLTVAVRCPKKEDHETALAIAAVPLSQYLASAIFSVTLQTKINETFGNRLIPMALSIIVTTAGSIPMALLSWDSLQTWMYILAPMQGIGNALMLNTSTAIISDVIGNDNTSAAFVYGAYSLADKFANGVLLFYLVSAYADEIEPLALIMAIVPTVSAIACTFATWLGYRLYADKLAKMSVSKKRKSRSSSIELASAS